MGDEGPLAPGAMPSMNVQCEKSLIESLAPGPVAKAKPKKKAKPAVEKMVPQTLKESRPQLRFETVQLRRVEEKRDDILKEGGEARRLAISLGGLSYSESLVDELFNHSKALEKLYQIVRGELAKGNNAREDRMKNFIKVYDQRKEWYEQAKART